MTNPGGLICSFVNIFIDVKRYLELKEDYYKESYMK